MGLFDSFRGRSISLLDNDFWSLFYGRRSSAGVDISDRTALQLSTFWGALRITSQAVASMSLVMYRKKRDGTYEEVENAFSDTVNLSPNEYQTPFDFWQGQIAWMLARGNAYAFKRLNSSGELIGLDPMPADMVHVKRNSDDELIYQYDGDDFPARKVFHMRGFGMSGDCGMSVVQHGVQSLGMAWAADQSAAKIFANGLQVSGVLSTENGLKADQRKQLQEVMQEFMGSKNAHKLMILEAGLKYQGITLNPDDAQLLESRRFNIEEICRWFSIPPILVGHAAQGQTMWGSGVEQIMLGWLTTSLNPLIRSIEMRMRKDLIPVEKRRQWSFKFNRETLLQADSAAKANYLSTMTQNGLMSRNEARSKLDLPPVPGGDKLTAQTNLAPLELLGQNGNNSQRDRPNEDEED